MNGMLDKLAPGFSAKLAFLADALLAGGCVVLATRVGTSFYSYSDVLVLMSMATGGWSIAIAVLRLYSPYTPRSLADTMALTLLAAGCLAIGLFVIDRVLLSTLSSHFDPLWFFVFFSGSALVSHILILSPLSRKSVPEDDVLVVGTSSLGVATYRKLRQSPDRRRRVVGFLRLDGEPDLPTDVSAPLLGSAEELLEVLERIPVSEVYLAERVIQRGDEMQRLVDRLEEVGMPFAIPVHSLRFQRATLLSKAYVSDGYLHYLTTESRPVQWAIKRLSDIVLASVALLLLSPLLLSVAIAIRLSSPGPVLFRQTRVGLHGAHFQFLKFRSMVVNAEALKRDLLERNEQTGPVFKMQRDPRVTPVGRFIRKFSIDELPQLINVVRGDMTIVGPRPPIPSEVAQYRPWQRRRLSVRPGLTCYWQVGGRNQIGFDEWMLLDLRYIDNWTLLKDLALILRTVPVVLLGKGAS